jgi:hypothetical protein
MLPFRGLRLAVLALAIAGCGSPIKSLLSVTGTGSVTVTVAGSGQYTIDFGGVDLGQQKSAALALLNADSSPVQILQVGHPSDAEFGITLSAGASIAPKQSIEVPVDFKPFSEGSKSGVLVIRTDSASTPALTLSMKGVGVVGKLEVFPQTIDFGAVVVHTRGNKRITLTNGAGSDVLVTPSAVQGPSAQLFTLDPSAPFTLASGGSALISITYAPAVPTGLGAPDNALFTLTSSAGNAVVTINLAGEATQSGLQITPKPLDFNFVQPGQQRTLPLHISNIGNQTVSVSSISVTIPSGVFALATGAPHTATLPPGQALEVNVTFTPTATQPSTGELQVVSNDNLGLQTVPLQGYGGGAAITCAPTVLDFGLVPANFTVTLPVTCVNTGSDIIVNGQLNPNAELVLSPYGFRITGNGVFGASIDPQSRQGPLAAGQSVQVDVAYTPVATESDTATLTVVSNVTTPPAPPVLSLSGQGIKEGKCYYHLAPRSLDWGQVVPGGNVYTQTFTLTNLGPNECLVNGVSLLPGSDGSFRLPDVVSQRLSPLGTGGVFPTSLTVPVSFSPQTAGRYAGAVGFTISDPDAPNIRVPLTGSGGNSCFLVKPPQLSFGVVGLSNGQYCSTGKASFAGVNGCATPVAITGITWPSLPSFGVIAATVPVTVPAGTSSPPFELSFKPTAPGAYFGAAQVHTDLQTGSFGVFFEGTAAVGSTQTDRLFGTGAVADILWVMDTDDDDSERLTMAGGASDFVTGLVNEGIDFQIAVTSSDICPTGRAELGRILPCPGCKLDGSTPTIITSGDFNAGSDLQTLLEVGGSASNSCTPDEQLFEATYEALVSGAGAAYNNLNGFIRPGASLAVIVVNGDNEDDNSRTSTWDWYASQFLSVKGTDHPELFSWSYINPTGYGVPGGHLSFNRLPQRLALMLEQVGGVALDSNQQNWQAGVLDLWKLLTKANTQFALSGSPDPGSIKVYLDGPPPDQVSPGQSPGIFLQATNVNLSWNWAYDATSNQIMVNPQNVPLTSTDSLYVEYTLLCSG